MSVAVWLGDPDGLAKGPGIQPGMEQASDVGKAVGLRKPSLLLASFRIPRRRIPEDFLNPRKSLTKLSGKVILYTSYGGGTCQLTCQEWAWRDRVRARSGVVVDFGALGGGRAGSRGHFWGLGNGCWPQAKWRAAWRVAGPWR